MNMATHETTERSLASTYLAACWLRVELDHTPRWRPGKRRRLDEALRHACDAADEDLVLAGGQLETPLYELLRSAAHTNRGRAR